MILVFINSDHGSGAERAAGCSLDLSFSELLSSYTDHPLAVVEQLIWFSV